MARIEYRENGEPYRWPDGTIIQWPDPERPYFLRKDEGREAGEILGDYPTLQEAMNAAGYPNPTDWERIHLWLRVRKHVRKRARPPWIDLTEAPRQPAETGLHRGSHDEK